MPQVGGSAGIAIPPLTACKWGVGAAVRPFGPPGWACQPPVPPPRATRVGHFSVPDWTLWLPGASLTCPLPNGSISGVRIQSGATGGLSMPCRIREQAVLKLRKARLKSSRFNAVPEAAMTEQGRVADPTPGHFELFRDRSNATCR